MPRTLARLCQFRDHLVADKIAPRHIAQRRQDLRQSHAHAAVHLLKDHRPHRCANHRLGPGQKRVALALGVTIAGCFFWNPLGMAIGLSGLFVLFSLAVVSLRVFLLILSTRLGPQEPTRPTLADRELPTVTILCPMYHEEAGLPGLVEALNGLHYPSSKLDIKIVLEADDTGTIVKAKALCTADHFDIVVVPPGQPRTKPKACNYALWSALGDILVIYDVEDRPDPDQLRLAAQAFRAYPDHVACLQARLNYYNRDVNWITRLFAIEYALLFDLVLPGLARIGAPLPLGGTSNLFRTHHLIELGGWDPFNVTEDADLGLRMAAAGLTSKMLDSTTYEEATQDLLPWLRQRSRWIKGYLQTWIVHARVKNPTWAFRLTLHILVGGVAVAALVNPVFWTLYLLWLSGMGGWAEALFPPPLGGIATFALLVGNLFHIWLFMLAPMRRAWHDLVPYGLLAPYYWALQSAAGYKAVWQFIFRPFYWEKTQHGAGQSAKAVLARGRMGEL